MQSGKTMHNWTIAGLLIVCGVLLGYQQSQAMRPIPKQPSVIAMVNLEVLFQGLDERAVVDEKVKAIASELETTAEQMRDDITLLTQDLQLLNPGTPEHLEAEERLVWESGRMKAFVEYAAQKLDALESAYLRDIYEEIKVAAGSMATELGIDVVFVDDSVSPLPERARENEMMRQISARRTLFTSPEIDVTQELMIRMNNEFNVQKGG